MASKPQWCFKDLHWQWRVHAHSECDQYSQQRPSTLSGCKLDGSKSAHQYRRVEQIRNSGRLESCSHIFDRCSKETRERLGAPTGFQSGKYQLSQIHVDRVNITKTESGAATNGVRSTSAKPSTPRPESDATSTLNPKAPDFQPNSRPA